MSTNLIPTTPKTAAEIQADAIVNGVNQQLKARVSTHKIIWSSLWESPATSAVDILAALGPRGVRALQAGAQSVADLTACAAIAGTTVEALVGDAKYLTTKLPVSITEDGVVTISDD
jgi:hypothetical protein